MADKTINELAEASSVMPQDLFVLQQESVAKKLSGQTLINYLLRQIDGHGGIQKVAKVSTNGLKDTYRMTFADETYFDFTMTNGRAISSVSQTAASGLTRTYTIAFNDGSSQTFKVTDGKAITSVQQTSNSGLTRTYTIAFNDETSQNFTVTDGRSITDVSKSGSNGLTDTYAITFNDGSTDSFQVSNGRGISGLVLESTDGLQDTYRLSYNDGTSSTITVTNGAKGDKGDNTYTHIKYASQQPTESSHSMGDIPDDWMGVYWGASATAPTSWSEYKWCRIKGDTGETGAPSELTSAAVEYQVSDNGTITPSGAWSSTIPVVAQGNYLWTRVTLTFNAGSPVVSYSVARMGVDGTGSVRSVANKNPDENGNVVLNADDVYALPIGGGTMTGPIEMNNGGINMNGQSLSGLNAPKADTDAATKGYVDGNFQANTVPHIVERGTSGIWTYRRWDNNFFECWGILPYDAETQPEEPKTSSFGIGQVPYRAYQHSFPCEFVYNDKVTPPIIPTVMIGPSSAGTGLSSGGVDAVTAKSVTVAIFGLDTAINGGCHVYACGTWKQYL